MPAANLLALIDDIATVLDDVAVLTKLAARKTAGVLGDDLALNAQQVSGVRANREIPVVWAVAKGSFVNKAILVPAALVISALIPWAITPLLMAGGAYLCFEGFEKLAHRWLHGPKDTQHRADMVKALSDPEVDPVALEKKKIKGAIRTDFILSAEIIIITLGTVAAAALPTRMTVLIGIAILMTVGVYGIVAGIVKLDDAGLYLSRREGEGGLARLQQRLGFAILSAAPWLMKGLSIAGTAAMFLVGGGILVHGVPSAHHWVERAAGFAAEVPAIGGALGALSPMILNGLTGVIAGALLVLAVTAVQRFRRAAPT